MSANPDPTATGRGADHAFSGHAANVDRMDLTEFVRLAQHLVVPWAWQLGSVSVLLLGASRLLGPAVFAAAAAAGSLGLVASSWGLAIGGRITAERLAEPAKRSSVVAWVAIAASLVAVSPLIGFGVDLPIGRIWFLAPTALLATLTGARIAAGPPTHQRSGAAIPIAAAGCARAAIGIAAIAGFGLAGLAAGFVLAELVGVAATRLGPHTRQRLRPGSGPSLGWLDGGYAWTFVASIMLVGQLDVLLVHRWLAAEVAGAYAGAAIVTRLLVLVPSLLATLAASRPGPTPEPPTRWLRRLAVTTGLASAIAAFAVVLVQGPVERMLLGTSTGLPRADFAALAATGALLGLVWELSWFHIVVGSKGYRLILAAYAVEVVILSAVRATPDAIAIAALVSSGVASLIHHVGASAVARWSPPLSRLREHEELDGASTVRPDLDVELSLVLPCYNPGPALEDFLLRLTALLRAETTSELIVVSDGSTDGSVDVARRLPSPAIRVIRYPEREGKGHALRVGLQRARGSYVGFIDADGEIDPDAVRPFLSLMRLYEPDLILGSKRHPMSEVTYPWTRRIMSWTYHKLTRVAFRVNVRDTQTGLKVIRRDVLTDVLPRMFEKRYAFDLELLVVARALGYTRVFEAPVRIRHSFSSSVDPWAVFQILLDTTAIFYRRYILDTYRHAGDRLMLVPDRSGSASSEGA